MQGKLDSLEVRPGFIIKKGSIVYLNFDKGGGSRSVFTREVTDIILKDGGVEIEVVPMYGGLFSKYDSSQFENNAFASSKEAEAY